VTYIITVYEIVRAGDLYAQEIEIETEHRQKYGPTLAT
jgi:hypothetical protein